MKKELMKTNCYDIDEVMIIVGSCLDRVQNEAYRRLEAMSDNIYEVCLEETHINMVFSKLIGIISRNDIKKIVFATVDKSPHCVQLHYLESEIRKAINNDDIEIIHYVAVDNKLVEISSKTISDSKNLSKLEGMIKK